ncbi:hypothetical protein NQ318_018738, partial [Aromia moschata]
YIRFSLISVAKMESTTELLDYLFNGTNKSPDINDTVDINSAGTKANFLLYDYLIPTIGTLTMLANFAVVISSGLILRKGQEPRSTYLFLGNVAMTDLITGFAVVFGQLYPKNKRDHYLCACQLGMIVSSTLTSVYSVGLIAIDRFLYIIHGMKYQKWVYPNRARTLIFTAWVLGIIIGFLPLMGWHGDTNNGTICWFIILAPKGLVLLTVLIGVVPLVIVVFLYSIILYHALNKINQLQRPRSGNTEEDLSSGRIRMFRGGGTNIAEQENDEPQEETNVSVFRRFFKKKPSPSVKAPNKWKAIKVVLFTTGSFVVTWCPYFVTSLVYVYTCDLEDTSKHCKTLRILIASPLAILGFMNSLLNPIIYAWWHKGFRGFVKKTVNSIALRRTGVEDNATSSDAKTSSSRGTSVSSKKNRTQVSTSDSNFE